MSDVIIEYRTSWWSKVRKCQKKNALLIEVHFWVDKE